VTWSISAPPIVSSNSVQSFSFWFGKRQSS
jgi:hypothetical protein